MTKTNVTNQNKEVAIKNILSAVATDKYNNKAFQLIEAIECRTSLGKHYYEVTAKFRGRKVSMKISIYENTGYVWWGKNGWCFENLPSIKSEYETLAR